MSCWLRLYTKLSSCKALVIEQNCATSTCRKQCNVFEYIQTGGHALSSEHHMQKCLHMEWEDLAL